MPSVKAKEWQNSKVSLHTRATEIVERAERENRDLTQEEENEFEKCYRGVDRYTKMIETDENNVLTAKRADALAEQHLMDKHATKSSGQATSPNIAMRAEDSKMLGEISEHPENVSRSVSREFQLENFYPLDPAFRVSDGARSASLYDFEPTYDPIAYAQRTISTGLAPSPGAAATTNLDAGVPTWVQTLIEHLVQEGMLTRYASRIQTAHGNELVWPKTSAYSSARIVGEGASITASEPTFQAPLKLNAWKYAFIILVTPEALADVRFGLGNFLMRQGRAALARAFNTHIVNGTGTSQPRGLVTASAAGVTGAESSYIPTYDELISLVHSVIPPYRNRGSAFLLSDNTLASIRKIKNNSTDNLPIFQPSYFAGQPDRILGWPIVVDYNVPDAGASARKAIVFGDLSSYFMRFAGGIRIGRSIHDKWDTDMISMRFIFRADGDLSDNNAVKHWATKAS